MAWDQAASRKQQAAQPWPALPMLEEDFGRIRQNAKKPVYKKK
jgi:hypothetical protein